MGKNKIFSVLFVLLFSSSLVGQILNPDMPSAKWKCVKTPDNLYGKHLNANEYLSFDKNTATFGLSQTDAEPQTIGVYAIINNQLTLTYNERDKVAAIDSTVYKVIDNKPFLFLYENSRTVSVVDENGLSIDRKINSFTVTKCTNDTLLLTAESGDFLFINQSPLAPVIKSIDETTGFNLGSLARGIFGMAMLIFIAFLFSNNKKQISWKVVIIGLALQLVLALAILYVPFVQSCFEFVGNLFVKVLDFTKAGSRFLLGDLMNVESYGFIFVFQILPTIIFFSALTSVLFYLGVIQGVVYGLAWLMTKLLKLSGAESLSVAGNIFLGQTESPLMIKAYLEKMNKSEILLVMVGGMATVAGGVLAAYIEFLGGSDPVQRIVFAKHLLAASIMAAPGAVVISKILVPQTEAIDKEVKVAKEKVGSNLLDAMAIGTTEGLKLAANVGAMLLVFFAFIAMANFVLYKIGDWTSINAWITDATDGGYKDLSLQFILGYGLSPLMWIIGVCKEDITLVGQLLGEKLIASEFVGYSSLAVMKNSGLFFENKSIIISTYMLCGFANFASIGIQIGGIGSLAPGQRTLLSKYGLKALIGGTLASLLSATIVGMILG